MKAELLRPSELTPAELALWRGFAARPALRRAFLAPGFALACEAAHGRARVAVLHAAGAIAGFLPLQFAGRWQQAAGLAERIGGELCDAAGLLAGPGARVDPADLLRQCRLGALFMTHLVEGQAEAGLAPEATEPGHLIDLSAGSAAYLAGLRPDLLRDTTRRLRRAERERGGLAFAFGAASAAEARALIGRKRAQYRRTGAADPFAGTAHLAVIEALCEAPAQDCRPMLARLAAADGRVLAEHLGLLCGDVLSYWFPVYDPAAEKLSPGRLLLWRLIAQAEALGVALIDRGAGDTPAKRDFSSRTQALGVANWSAGTARGVIARGAQSVAWRVGRLGRKARQGLRP